MIQFSSVHHTYPNGTKSLQGVSFEVKDKEFVFLVGASGSGKSTIMKMITAELFPDSGQILVNGFNTSIIRPVQVPYLRRTLGVVFQDFRLLEHETVFDNVAFAMRVVGASPKQIKTQVMEVLETVGLPGKAKSRPSELSGGEQQRIAIARALVNRPKLIVADEPTGNLDPERSKDIMQLLIDINRGGTTVLVVTHAKELVDHFDRRVLTIDKGQVISDRPGGYYAQQF